MSGNVYFNGKRFGKVNLEDYKFSEGIFFEKEEIETLKFAIRYFHNYYTLLPNMPKIIYKLFK